MKLFGSGIGMDHSWSLVLLSTAFLPVVGILCPLGSCLGVKDGLGRSDGPLSLPLSSSGFGIHQPGWRGELFPFSPWCCVDTSVGDPVDVS